MSAEVVADATLQELAERFSVSEATVLSAWQDVVALLPRLLVPFVVGEIVQV